MAKYSVVVPVFNEEETIGAFVKAVMPVMESVGEPFEIIFVNDGSKDKTEEILDSLAGSEKRIKVIHFSRNFGQQAAILAGFEASTGDAVLDIDVDLQDPVEAIPEMIAKWKEGFDIVHGKRKVRKGETFFKKKTASAYTKFFEKITGLKIPEKCGDFKLFDRKVIDVIVSMPERDRFLRGITEWVGFKQTFVEFERQKRVAGKTKYNFKKLMRLATNGIVSNSGYPLSVEMKMGAFTVGLSLAAFVTFIVLVCCGIGLPLVSWVFPTVTLLFGINWLVGGIKNIYIERIYREVQNRPKYIVRTTRNFKDEK